MQNVYKIPESSFPKKIHLHTILAEALHPFSPFVCKKE